MKTTTNVPTIELAVAAGREPTDIEQYGILYQIRKEYGLMADTDGYKLSHHCQYIPGATRMISYIESRGGKYDRTLWFGLQLIIKEYLLGKLTQQQADNMVAWATEHLAGNIAADFRIAMQTVIDEYDGRMPIKIRAAQEGLVIPVQNVLATIETSVSDNRIFSIVSYLETLLLRVWGPTTVSTTSWHIREVIYEFLQRTADDPDAEIPFKLHDFGSRGVAPGAAAFLGAGHLAVFQGSDTTIAVLAANIAYHCQMSAYTIPATEHSTTTSRGRNGEESLLDTMFDKFAKPGALFATVIDSWDALDFIRTLAPKYIKRLQESGATWVFRPDSCDPVQMPVQTVVELAKVFGYTKNSKGYKVLKNVRVLQGDGIVAEQVEEILYALLELGFSASNIAFGMGGGLLQKNDRDTQKFSMKCCAVEVDGKWIDVYKDPSVYDKKWNKIDVESFKKSKAGRLELMFNTQTGAYATMTHDVANEYKGAIAFGWTKALETVYENGYLVRDMTMQQVRENAGVVPKEV